VWPTKCTIHRRPGCQGDCSGVGSPDLSLTPSSLPQGFLGRKTTTTTTQCQGRLGRAATRVVAGWGEGSRAARCAGPSSGGPVKGRIGGGVHGGGGDDDAAGGHSSTQHGKARDDGQSGWTASQLDQPVHACTHTLILTRTHTIVKRPDCARHNTRTTSAATVHSQAYAHAHRLTQQSLTQTHTHAWLTMCRQLRTPPWVYGLWKLLPCFRARDAKVRLPQNSMVVWAVDTKYTCQPSSTEMAEPTACRGRS
jgi:hypothetical protein